MASDIQASLSLYNNMSTTLQGIISTMNNVISAAQNVEGATGKMFDRTGLEAAQIELNRAGRELAKMQTDIENSTIEQEKFNDKLRKSIDLSGSLKRTIAGIAATYLGIQGVKKFFAGADEMAGINARLGMIADKQHTVRDLQEEIFKSAERSRGSYQMTADIVGKLGTQAGNAFKNNNELIAFSEQLNKNLTLAGTDPQGVQSVMYNLTQAMASGVLRGQDLNSVMANAPNILAKVADYLGKDRSEIRKLAEEGKLSASVIKEALLSSAEETNKAFENMPKTLGQIVIDFKNNFIHAMIPAFEKFTAFMNSDNLQKIGNIIIKGAVSIANTVGFVVGLIIDGAEMVYDSWEYIKTPLMVLIGLMALYKAEVIAVNSYLVISKGLHVALATAKGLLSVATRKATIGQMGFNAALLTSPIFWIPAVIIAIIGIIYGIVAAINKLKGTSISATGLIVGSIATAITFVLNMFIGFFNAIIQLKVNLKNRLLDFSEFFSNVFKHPIASVKALFANLVSDAIDMLKSLARVIDTVFGTETSKALGNLSDKVQSWKNNSMPSDYKFHERINDDNEMIKRFEYQKSFNDWYDKGDNFQKKFKVGSDLSNIKNSQEYGNMGNLKNMANSLENTDINTKDIRDKLSGELKFTNTDLSYLRELAIERGINKFSFEKIEVNASNNFGDINNIADIDGFTDIINKGLEDAIFTTAQGLGAV